MTSKERTAEEDLDTSDSQYIRSDTAGETIDSAARGGRSVVASYRLLVYWALIPVSESSRQPDGWPAYHQSVSADGARCLQHGFRTLSLTAYCNGAEVEWFRLSTTPGHRYQRPPHSFQNAPVKMTNTGMISRRPNHIRKIIRSLLVAGNWR